VGVQVPPFARRQRARDVPNPGEPSLSAGLGTDPRNPSGQPLPRIDRQPGASNRSSRSGSAFVPDDETPNPQSVLCEGRWRRAFGARSDVGGSLHVEERARALRCARGKWRRVFGARCRRFASRRGAGSRPALREGQVAEGVRRAMSAVRSTSRNGFAPCARGRWRRGFRAFGAGPPMSAVGFTLRTVGLMSRNEDSTSQRGAGVLP